MDFSSEILRPALNRIKSSLASTSSRYRGFITRALSFTGSFNDRTSLLREDDAELVGRPTQAEEAAPEAAAAAPVTTTASAGHPFDIEAGTTTTPLDPTGTAAEGPAAGQEEPADAEVDAEARRVGKSVQTVCLFAASASLVLFVNLPTNKQQPGGAGPPASSSPSGQNGGGAAASLLYSADMAFISLAFFSSLGLSMFSIVARPGGEAAAVVRVQKWGMVVAVASVVVAFSLRVCMMASA